MNVPKTTDAYHQRLSMVRELLANSILRLPKHAFGLYLEHNAHRDHYDPLWVWLASPQGSIYSFRTPDDRQRCIETNELWTLQWYPRTPVGFNSIAAPTLAELLAYAAEVEKGDKQ